MVLNAKKTCEVTFQEEHTVASKNQNTRTPFCGKKFGNKCFFMSAGTRNLHFVPSASVAPLVAEHMSISLQPIQLTYKVKWCIWKQFVYESLQN